MKKTSIVAVVPEGREDGVGDAVARFCAIASVGQVFLVRPGTVPAPEPDSSEPASGDGAWLCGAVPVAEIVCGTAAEGLNRAIDAIECDFVSFVDVDDVFCAPRALDVAVGYAALEGRPVAVCAQSDAVRTQLSKLLIDSRWLKASGVRFPPGGADSLLAFARMAVSAAGGFFHLARYTVKSRRIDMSSADEILRCLRAMAEFAVSRGDVALKAELAEDLLVRHAKVLTDAAWGQDAKAADAVKREVSAVAAALGVSTEAEERIFSPLVTFVIPVYNAERQVGRCLDSILSVPIRNIEVICVDDGSEDAGLEVLRSHAERDGRITVLTQTNSGQGSARNRGMALAKGRYVQFVDSDDYIVPSMYPRVLEPFEKHPEIDFVQFLGSVEFDFDDVTPTMRKWGDGIFKTTLRPGLHRVGEDTIFSTIVVNRVYRREFIAGNNLVFPSGLKQEDEAFAFFIFARARKFWLFHDKWYRYVRTKTGTMSTQESQAQDMRLPDCYPIFNHVLGFLSRENSLFLMGFFFKRVIGATTRFAKTPIAGMCMDCAAHLLRKGGFREMHDLMLAVDRAKWLREEGRRLCARELPDDFAIAPVDSPLPVALPPHPAEAAPKISYIVFADTFEAFLPRALQSIAAQDCGEFEAVCVSSGRSAAVDATIERFMRGDGRFSHVVADGGGDRRRLILAALGSCRSGLVVLHEGKDWLPSNHASSCIAAAGADVAMVPDRYFDTETYEPREQLWSFDNNRRNFPFKAEFTFSDCEKACFGIDINVHCYSRAFLEAALPSAPEWRELPSATFLYLLVSASSIRTVTGTHCMVRLGSMENVPYRAACDRAKALAGFAREMFSIAASEAFSALAPRAQGLAMRYAVSKMRFLVSKFPSLAQDAAAAWDGVARPVREAFARDFPKLDAEFAAMLSAQAKEEPSILSARYAATLERIGLVRAASEPDTYVIVSFLNDPAVECIDSWTFFVYLRNRGVPAKYVTCADNAFYANAVAGSPFADDVIALRDAGASSSELADRLLPHLYRIKAVVAEDGYLPFGLSDFFKVLPGLDYVYMRHGVAYIWQNDSMLAACNRFNAVNSSGAPEAEKMQGYAAERGLSCDFDFLRGGLPRYDLLDANRSPAERSVLVALSWRNDFRTEAAYAQSAFAANFRLLAESGVWEELRRRGVRTVLAVHHAMRRTLGGDVLSIPGVEVVDSSGISSHIRSASCLVTDFSSVAFDFLYQGKPVFFWIPDTGDYALSFASRTKIAAAAKSVAETFGLCRSVGELENALLRSESGGFRIADAGLVSWLDGFFGERGRNCERLHEAIERHWRGNFGREAES